MYGLFRSGNRGGASRTGRPASWKSADQREPMSWQFYVIPERELPDQKTIGLSAIRRLAQPCGADRLRAALEAAMGQR